MCVCERGVHALLCAVLLTSCFRIRATTDEFVLPCCSQGDAVDVKGLRARFNNPSTSDTSSRDSGSPKSPRPGFGRAILPVTESELAHRLSPTVPPPLAGPGPVKFPRAEPLATSSPRPSFPRPPLSSGPRAPFPPPDANKIKQTGEMLQNIMLRHQRPPGIKPPPGPALPPAQTAAPSPSSPHPFRLQPRQRSAGDVAPLRKPLPPLGPLPLKPKRPPNVNLEPFMRRRNNGKLSDLFAHFFNNLPLILYECRRFRH